MCVEPHMPLEMSTRSRVIHTILPCLTLATKIMLIKFKFRVVVVCSSRQMEDSGIEIKKIKQKSEQEHVIIARRVCVSSQADD